MPVGTVSVAKILGSIETIVGLGREVLSHIEAGRLRAVDRTGRVIPVEELRAAWNQAQAAGEQAGDGAEARIDARATNTN